ncbi:MAG: hypothetical protein RLW62_12055 [Gammaproteobacteria bacterium]
MSNSKARSSRQPQSAAFLCALLVLPGILVSSGAAAFDPLADARTIAGVQADFWNEHRSAFEITEDDRSSVTALLTSTRADGTDLQTPGWVDAKAVADFGTLKAQSSNNIGSTSHVRVGASFHDVYTVQSSGGIAAGTPGVATWVFNVSGSATLVYDPIAYQAFLDSGQSIDVPNLVAMGLSMTKFSPNGNGSTSQEAFSTSRIIVAREDVAAFGPDTVTNGGFYNVFLPNGHYSFDIPFIYDEPFALNTAFDIETWTPSRFLGQTSNPFFLRYDFPIFSAMEVDFLHTAELVAIVNPDDPAASITGLNLDYSAYVSAAAPAVVPLPATAPMLIVGIGLIRFMRSRIRRVA